MNKKLLKQRIKARLTVKETDQMVEYQRQQSQSRSPYDEPTFDRSNLDREEERYGDMVLALQNFIGDKIDPPVNNRQFDYLIEDLQKYHPNYNVARAYDKMVAGYNNWVSGRDFLLNLLKQINTEIARKRR